MTGLFAPEYNRDAEGRVLFPHDTALRKKLFLYTDPAEHIAKTNMYMMRALVEFVSDEGEVILDPFAGTGTVLVAATIGRRVLMIEFVILFIFNTGQEMVHGLLFPSMMIYDIFYSHLLGLYRL